MKNIKILVTGATGFVGQLFCDKISKEFTNIEVIRIGFSKKKEGVISADLSQLDETKRLIESVKPTHVFHFAAMVNPKLNEENKYESYRKNFIVTNNLVAACSQNSTIYFLSTDKVYDSCNKNAIEEDVTQIPDNFYSLMKIICENLISTKFSKHFILRCPIIHSLGDPNSNSFIDSALIKLSENEKINVFDNVVRHYILIDELITFLIELLFSDKYGTYNVGTFPISYYERIFSLANLQGLNTSLIETSKGNVLPEIQTYNITKLETTFNKKFK
jgi:dTDP-4-dehydrorhamnose reductase